MTWFRDTLKALGWAAGAAGVAAAAGLTGLTSGLGPVVLPLLAAPPLAYGYHKSGRVAGLVAMWLVALVAAFAGFVAWVFRDFQFRAIQG
jgi:hypothetical protein